MCSDFYSGYKQFKDTGHWHTVHDGCTANPFIEIPGNIHANSIGSPDSKQSSLYSINLHGMCSKFFICLIINACTELLFFFLCDLAWKSIRIIAFCLDFTCFYRKFIFRHLMHRKQYCKISCLIFLFTDISFIFTYYTYPICARKKSLDQDTIWRDSWSHYISGRCFLSIHNSFNSWPVHITV